MSYIVELETGVWIAGTEGDPGRTVVEASAQLFDSHDDAIAALSEARKFRPFESACVSDIDPFG